MRLGYYRPSHSRVAGNHGGGKIEEKLTSGRENRLKSRGLSSAIGRARAGGKKGKETAEDRASELLIALTDKCYCSCLYVALLYARIRNLALSDE